MSPDHLIAGAFICALLVFLGWCRKNAPGAPSFLDWDEIEQEALAEQMKRRCEAIEEDMRQQAVEAEQLRRNLRWQERMEAEQEARKFTYNDFPAMSGPEGRGYGTHKKLRQSRRMAPTGDGIWLVDRLPVKVTGGT